jgi:acetyl esterase/lipase
MPESNSLRPDLFQATAISPETQEYNARLEERAATFPTVYSQSPEMSRADREAGRSLAGPLKLSDMATERTIAGPGGDIPLRVFVPDTVRGVYLHIHGGGWVLGRAHHQDPRLEQMARNCGVAVVSVDYRLAPEDPYPAAPDDCEAAALWLVEHARSEFGSDRLLIGGASAGGNLAAVTLLRMRDRHGFTGFRAADLQYGVFDLTMTPSCLQWGDRNLVLSAPAMAWFIDHYVSDDRRTDPDVSPIYGDLSGLPPAIFTIGTLDPLLDDSLFMYARWIAAGSPGELAVYPGGVHGFNGHPIQIARDANARIDAFITQALAADVPALAASVSGEGDD